MDNLRDTEIERNTAACAHTPALSYADDTNTLLLVYPEKALSRPYRNAPDRMTKADPKLPGSSGPRRF
eukprot:COSAG06_NODE_857_length_11918_cov_4.047551_3_plen_68_part_00